MGSSHFKFNVFILNPILTLSSEHYSWQCGIFSVPSGWEAARPRAWGPPWVPGMRDQCWWQCPPGAGEHGTGQLSAVNEKTKWWGILWEFLIAATALVVGSCPSAMGRLSSSILCTAVFRLNTKFTLKNKSSIPPPLCFLTHRFWR